MKLRKHGSYVYMKEGLNDILNTPELDAFYAPSGVLLCPTNVSLEEIKESLKTIKLFIDQKIEREKGKDGEDIQE